MGYPSTFIESLYRNSLSDIKRFFKTEFENKVKVYNLCIEPKRIYPKDRFLDIKAALFPFEDHCCCPVK